MTVRQRIERRAVELILDGPHDFGTGTAQIIDELREEVPALTFASVLKIADRAYLAEAARRQRSA